MADTVSEIRDLFASSRDKTGCYQLNTLPPEYPAWIFRFSDGRYGAGIPYEGKSVNEKFNSIDFYTDHLVIDGQECSVLLFTSDNERSREQFAFFCLSLVSPGTNGLNRKQIEKSPVEWWEEWKELVGNSSVEKAPYAVIGEMIVLCQILKKDPKARWGGPKAASRDIETSQAEYEVKSTLKRFEKNVRISSQYQLSKGDKPAFLVFNRFEKKEDGYSINSVAEILKKKYGYPADELEKNLRSLGYEKGRSDREKNYILLEQSVYEVNDEFPAITPVSFKDESIPMGIMDIEYVVDLYSCTQCQTEDLDPDWSE